MAQRLLDERGRLVKLGTKLGAGGEGAVYRLADRADMAVKVYNQPLSVERAMKIQVLSSMPRERVERFAAWPAGLVLDDGKRPRGLLLPVVERAKDVHYLYGPASRKAAFPAADWRFLVHVATNVARAFATVGTLGLVIGDVNQGSVLVAPDGTVKLIDVDSFQVPRSGGPPLLCTVAVPLFTPPELHGARLDAVVRSSNHDSFGLAVLIFQLLMLGRHPYAGRYSGVGDMPIERAIREHRFAFSANAAARQMAPPPHTVGLDILPKPLADLFERAFSPLAGSTGRPAATDWVAGLNALGECLVGCHQNVSHHHANTLTLCPWCSFEADTGVFLFSVPVVPSTASRLEGEYAQLSSLLASIAVPASPAVPPSPPAAAPHPDAVRAAGAGAGQLAGYALGTGLLATGFLVLQDSGIPLLIGLLVLILAVVATRRRHGPWAAAYRSARDAHQEAEAQLQRANSLPSSSRVRSDLGRAQARWDAVPGLRAHRYRELETNKRNDQLMQYLGAQLVEQARVSGIGRGRAAILSAYGIDTAAEVSYGRVAQVPQFGEVLTRRLVEWRMSVERSFVFDPKRPLPQEAVARVEKEVEDERRRAVDELRRGIQALRSASAADVQAARLAADQLVAARRRLAQAEADAKVALRRLPK